MLSHISRLLEAGAISPQEIAAREKAEQERKAKAEREKELCAMGPWKRHLEENPQLKKWADANPAAAETAKARFLKNPKNQAECGSGFSNWQNLNVNYSDFYKK